MLAKKRGMGAPAVAKAKAAAVKTKGASRNENVIWLCLFPAGVTQRALAKGAAPRGKAAAPAGRARKQFAPGTLQVKVENRRAQQGRPQGGRGRGRAAGGRGGRGRGGVASSLPAAKEGSHVTIGGAKF